MRGRNISRIRTTTSRENRKTSEEHTYSFNYSK